MRKNRYDVVDNFFQEKNYFEETLHATNTGRYEIRISLENIIISEVMTSFTSMNPFDGEGRGKFIQLICYLE